MKGRWIGVNDKAWHGKNPGRGNGHKMKCVVGKVVFRVDFVDETTGLVWVIPHLLPNGRVNRHSRLTKDAMRAADAYLKGETPPYVSEGA